MAEKDKKFYWLKLKSEFMNGEIVDFLMSQKNGANYVVLYQMLALKTLNTQGRLCSEMGEVIIPYDPEKIQRDCKWFDIDTVRVAMELYAKLGLVYRTQDGVMQIANYDELVGSETYWATRKRIQLATKEAQFQNIKKLSNEQFMLPNGETKFIDEKRYGGNGMAVWDRSGGKCEICGSTENLCIHHNNGYSNAYEDLVVVCRTCHREIEEGKKHWKYSNKCPTNVQETLISLSNSNSIIYNKEIDRATSILEYLNQEAGTHFKPVESNLKFINARLKDYTEEDLRAVIDKKVNDWKGGEMQMYLRPETLFNATKFETYLNGLEDRKGLKNYERKYSRKELNAQFQNIDEIEI